MPAWEREYERDRGLVGTSYESATVENVAPVGDGFLKITVDMAVTCTAQHYLSEGQFLFLKPWGDEDGSIEPCCFTAPPGENTTMDFYIPEVSAVGEAALAGEMLEVSEVMGEGFRPHLISEAYQQAERVVAVCIEQFCSPVLLALRDTIRPVDLYIIANDNGPFSAAVREWVQGAENRSVYYFADEDALLQSLEDTLSAQSSAAVLMSCDSQLCRVVNASIHKLREGRSLTVITP